MATTVPMRFLSDQWIRGVHGPSRGPSDFFHFHDAHPTSTGGFLAGPAADAFENKGSSETDESMPCLGCLGGLRCLCLGHCGGEFRVLAADPISHLSRQHCTGLHLASRKLRCWVLGHGMSCPSGLYFDGPWRGVILSHSQTLLPVLPDIVGAGPLDLRIWGGTPAQVISKGTKPLRFTTRFRSKKRRVGLKNGVFAFLSFFEIQFTGLSQAAVFFRVLAQVFFRMVAQEWCWDWRMTMLFSHVRDVSQHQALPKWCQMVDPIDFYSNCCCCCCLCACGWWYLMTAPGVVTVGSSLCKGKQHETTHVCII